MQNDRDFNYFDIFRVSHVGISTYHWSNRKYEICNMNSMTDRKQEMSPKIIK